MNNLFLDLPIEHARQAMLEYLISLSEGDQVVTANTKRELEKMIKESWRLFPPVVSGDSPSLLLLALTIGVLWKEMRNANIIKKALPQNIASAAQVATKVLPIEELFRAIYVGSTVFSNVYMV